MDLGKKKRKQVKKLRKGRGRVMNKIQDVIDGMREDGDIDPTAQAVVVVVRQKRRKGRWRF